MQKPPIDADFVNVIQDNERIIFKVCSLYTDKYDDLCDLYQDIVLQIWTSFPKFRNECKSSSWIYKIALNTAISFFRKAKKKPTHQYLSDLCFDIPDHKASEQDEKIKALYNMIGDLNNLEKALILLYLEDKKYEEIADITGLSVTNVATKLSRIKEKLRERAKTLYNN